MPPTISPRGLISDQDDEAEEDQSVLHLGQQFTDFAAFKAAMLRCYVAAQFELRYQISDHKANVVVCLSGAAPLQLWIE